MKRGHWIFLGCFGVLSLTSLIGIVLLVRSFWDFGSASGDLDDAVAAYQKRGLPMTTADLGLPKPDASKNAAIDIREAIRRMPKKSYSSEIKRGAGPGSDAVLTAFAPSLAVIDKASGKTQVDFGRDWDMGFNVLFPEYASLKTLAKILAIRAETKADAGDDQGALRDLETIQRLAKWSSQEPTLISVLVEIALDSIAANAYERCMASATAQTRLKRYADWIKRDHPMPSFNQAFAGEAFMGVTVYRNLDKMGGRKAISNPEAAVVPDPKTLRRSGLPEDEKQRAFLCRHLQFWTEAYDQTKGFTTDYERLGATLDRLENKLSKERGLSYKLNQILLPVFTQATLAVPTLDARWRTQRALTKARMTKIATGSWPKSVTEIDPFTKKPLLLRVEGDRLRVYSVGKNYKDENGVASREVSGSGPKPDDVVAAYPPLPR